MAWYKCLVDNSYDGVVGYRKGENYDLPSDPGSLFSLVVDPSAVLDDDSEHNAQTDLNDVMHIYDKMEYEESVSHNGAFSGGGLVGDEDGADYIDFDQAAAPTSQEARMAWDAVEETVAIGMPGGNVSQSVGMEILLPRRAKNASGVNISNGDLVYISGGTGVNAEVTLADRTDYDKAFHTIAMATENIDDNSLGWCTTFGLVRGTEEQPIDTSGGSAGDKLYLGAAGTFQHTQPSAPDSCVCVGTIFRSHATGGIVIVDIWRNHLKMVTDVTKEPTGFTAPENVVINGDTSTRTVTLTGTVNAYYEGVPVDVLTSGWESGAHGSDTAEQYFLVYDGTDFEWMEVSSGLSESFYHYLLICFAFYDSTNSKWVYLREPHSLMPWVTHREFHQTTGTYRRSGGALQDYVLDSITAADRRPSVEATLLYDEDLPTLSAVLNNSQYSNFYLSGADDTVNVVVNQADIVPLSTNRPYWNQFTGGAWQQTLMSNNYYMAVWVLCIPMASDSDSQQWRYLFIQGQSEDNSLSNIQALTPQDVSIGNLRSLLPELVVTNKIIIQYTASNWKIVEVSAITGTSSSQTTSPAGNYLTSVTTDSTINGQGTPSSPLSLLDVNSDVVVPNNLIQSPGSSETPATNGQMLVEATSNTTLTFKLKGTDGTVRSGTITLS